MPFTYQTGEEIKKGDRVTFHGDPGEIEFISDSLVDDPQDWYIKEFGGEVMVIEPDTRTPNGLAASSSPTQPMLRIWFWSPGPEMKAAKPPVLAPIFSSHVFKTLTRSPRRCYTATRSRGFLLLAACFL
jgi:hypothetical protein